MFACKKVNIGKIHDRKTTLSAIFGNSMIIQLQSIVVGFLASFLAVLFQFFKTHKFQTEHFLIVICSSVATASIASLLLASSLGDVVTLAILAGVGSFLFELSNELHFFDIDFSVIL